MKSITEYINEALAPASSPEYWEKLRNGKDDDTISKIEEFVKYAQEHNYELVETGEELTLRGKDVKLPGLLVGDPKDKKQICICVYPSGRLEHGFYPYYQGLDGSYDIDGHSDFDENPDIPDNIKEYACTEIPYSTWRQKCYTLSRKGLSEEEILDTIIPTVSRYIKKLSW